MRRTSRVYAEAVTKRSITEEETDKGNSCLSKGTAFVSMIDMHFLKCLKLVSFCVNYIHDIDPA